ncbi:hypothetical protein CspHIS471_0604690 [Cutaneotrichosporon sp. HIS471]|nr:hypothetical protein CspHIS471_0604690 [Cutaneotrichosporon sp. HIS471]
MDGFDLPMSFGKKGKQPAPQQQQRAQPGSGSGSGSGSRGARGVWTRHGGGYQEAMSDFAHERPSSPACRPKWPKR